MIGRYCSHNVTASARTNLQEAIFGDHDVIAEVHRSEQRRMSAFMTHKKNMGSLRKRFGDLGCTSGKRLRRLPFVDTVCFLLIPRTWFIWAKNKALTGIFPRHSGESNRPLTPIHVKKYRDTPPISMAYFCKYMPSLWQKVVYTPPICITIRLPFVSRYFCGSIRVRGRWDTPKTCSHSEHHAYVFGLPRV